MNNANNNKEITDELIDFYNNVYKNQKTETGYIWLPSMNGYEVYEVSKANLEIYLRMESMSNKNKSINDNKESS